MDDGDIIKGHRTIQFSDAGLNPEVDRKKQELEGKAVLKKGRMSSGGAAEGGMRYDNMVWT